MEGVRSINVFSVAYSLVLTLFLFCNVQGQDLAARLSQQTSYSPRAATTLEQLIEVAQHYKIPMGIEWVYSRNRDEWPVSTPVKPLTVQELIVSILQRSPGYVAQQRDGVIHIAKADLLSAPENFLNLRISKFEVQNENLFGVEAYLKRSISMTLHPERYTKAHNGGFGYGVPREDGFDKTNITISGRDITVREILNRIAAASDNAIWVVQLIPSEKMPFERFFAQKPLSDDTPTKDFHWKFIPLGQLTDPNRK